MKDQLLEELRTSIEGAQALTDESKAELLGHLAAIQEQLQATPENPDEAPATGELHGLAKLRASVVELEASHPDLTSLVSRLATHLSNLGI